MIFRQAFLTKATKYDIISMLEGAAKAMFYRRRSFDFEFNTFLFFSLKLYMKMYVVWRAFFILFLS